MSKEEEFTTVGRKVPKQTARAESFQKVLKSFTTIKDNLRGEEINIDLLDGLLASEDLDSEVDIVSVGYMLMSSLAAEAEERFENQKLAIDHRRAVLNEKAHDGVITARVTDAKVNAFIDRDIKVIKMERKKNEYRKQMKIYDKAARAYDIKHDMIQTKSANRRKQMEVETPSNPKKAHDKIMGKKETRK